MFSRLKLSPWAKLLHEQRETNRLLRAIMEQQGLRLPRPLPPKNPQLPYGADAVSVVTREMIAEDQAKERQRQRQALFPHQSTSARPSPPDAKATAAPAPSTQPPDNG